jgi:hypothetical protein
MSEKLHHYFLTSEAHELEHRLSIYPTDPQTRQCQTFKSRKEILEFVGDGEDGTFGFPSILEQSISDESCRYIIQITLLNKCIIGLKKENDIH